MVPVICQQKRIFVGIWPLSSDGSDYLVGGWTNPFEKNMIVKLDQIGSFPQVGVKINKNETTYIDDIAMCHLEMPNDTNMSGWKPNYLKMYLLLIMAIFR